ncbi:MAG TPA: site-specific integrase [Sedimentisphaerales bacterium]|nr:site-specific integrase [Sedimentisphaerales bacterium]
MAHSKKTKNNLPGSIYKNGNRYWWKVQLPGEDKLQARPLKPLGSKQATKDYNVAVECAKIMLAQAVFKSGSKISGTIASIAQLAKAYSDYANEYYKDHNGITTREVGNIGYALKPLLDVYATIYIEDFGPIKLIEVRNEMIKQNICRKTINQRIGVIKRMFKWAASQQIIPMITYQGLLTVEGLKRNRSTAKESMPVKPIDEKHVYMILDYTTPVVGAMIQIQLLTGMRPSEMLQMKPKDIDRSEQIWHYYPERHKNEYRGHERIVPIGPQGQKILMPFLLRNENSYCFSPAESEKYRREKLTENRKTPLSCGNTVGSNQKDDPQRKPGEVYDYKGYGKAVTRAIFAARNDIKSRGGDPDVEMPKWTPYQLRHTAATKTRKLFNYETAGALLGHSNMSATAVYAERNQGLADEAARKLG